MRRTLAGLLVSSVMAAVMASASPAGGVAGFGDVFPLRFYTDPVQWMVDNEITTGTSANCFSPENFVTRGQAAAFMWRMEGFPAGSPLHPFTDVVASWQREPVSWMADTGITTGTTATTYSPDEFLTRGQLAALLHRLAGFPDPGPSHPFTDVVKEWQQDAISWMFNNKITTGTSPMTFSPEDTVTRGQLAAFFYRYKGSPGVMFDPESRACSAALVGERFNLLANLVVDGDLALAEHPGCTEIGAGPPPAEDVVYECSTVDSHPAGVPFHVSHGLTFDGQDPSTWLAAGSRFDLALDGIPLPTQEVNSTDTSPETGSMRWVYPFRDGLTGSHTFVGEWYERGVLILRSEVVVAFT